MTINLGQNSPIDLTEIIKKNLFKSTKMTVTIPLKSIQLNPGSSVLIRDATWRQYLDLTQILYQYINTK